MEEFSHTPVLLGETLDALDIKADGIYVDGTLGGGGHAGEILKRLSARGLLIGIDRDEAAINAAAEKLKSSGARTIIIRGNYLDTPAYLKEYGISAIDGMLLDLGVSSAQFDDGSRGFSYRSDAPLDMRMDKRQTLTAYAVVNTYPEERLSEIIREYGEERFAAGIARHIASARKTKPIGTTFELAEIIKSAMPAKARAKKGHPAKRTFQAIRIEVNGELEILKNSVGEIIDVLKPGGRLAVISFHSLEDRIVKNAFRNAEDPCICPRDFPVCVCGRKPKGRVITRKAITPSEEEISNNPRAHSAKLRVFEKGAPGEGQTIKMRN